jgi:hypothetical protein
MRRLVFAIILLAYAPAAAASDEDARASRVMWIAFSCSTFAELAGEPEEQERLFRAGHRAGRQFFEAIEAGTITAEQIQEVIPIGVSMRAAGPSIDFIIGRVFEAAAQDAFDRVVKRDDRNLSLDLADWIRDPELRALVARNRYSRANCEMF